MKLICSLATVLAVLCLAPVLGLNGSSVYAQSVAIHGAEGSGRFGEKVYSLPNGNFVVVDHQYSAPGPISQVGAVYLYDSDANLISVLTGSSPNDRVGFEGVLVLANGNFVVRSIFWNRGATQTAGAYTWVDGATGLSGVVSEQNSLVGSTAGDLFSGEIVALSSGDYVVRAPGWDAGEVINAGAVIWADGGSGIAGPVSASNALTGSTAEDRVGSGLLVEFSNGNYLVRSPNWNNGAATRAGSVTWVEAGGGLTGVVSPENSLVGSSTDDFVGNSGITELVNGHFVIASGRWRNGSALAAGAVTWANGATGVVGEVSPANSLVGSSQNDRVGGEQILALSNGNYVVQSRFWDAGAVPDVGAVTWGNGQTGIAGAVSADNSLVGTAAEDRVGQRLYQVGDSNYVVRSTFWRNGTVLSAGAATWGNGATGVSGPVSPENSLVGTQPVDNVGADIDVLVNGNYVVRSTNWDNGGVMNAGAVTWADGNTGIVGPVTVSNSLVGSSANDRVGDWAVAILSNGHYVVRVPAWSNAGISAAGAVTWVDGTTGLAGPVSAANSLVGSQTQDRVGDAIFALNNGNYVVNSRAWDNGAVENVGAVTWGDGASGLTGPVSPANSLIGSSAGDAVGSVLPLDNGNYLVVSGNWDNGAVVDVGAVTWANGQTGLIGEISVANSLIGSSSGDFSSFTSVNRLPGGDYVVGAPSWSSGGLSEVGAVTWGDGATGVRGTISAASSLIGSSAQDRVSLGGFRALPDGNYVVASHEWNNGPIIRAGAVSLARADGSTVGVVGPSNSIGGTTVNAGFSLFYAYDPSRPQLIVGRPLDNTVNLLRFDNDRLFDDRFEGAP
jgi:hypothetical protein